MRGSPLSLLAALLLVLAGLPAFAQSLQNADFGAGLSRGAPAGWFLDPNVAPKGEIRVDGGVLTLAPNASNTLGGDGLAIGQALEAAPFHGQRLGISAQLSASGPATAAVGFVALDGNGAAIETVILRRTADQGAPQVVSDSMADPLPENARTLIVFLTVEGTSGAASFDDIRVAQVAAPAPQAAAAREVATITLDPARRLGPVQRDLFGTNVEWIRDANGLWNKDQGRIDPDMLAMMGEAGITLLRFPGGVWSDAYHWRDGIGPQAGRPSTPHVPGDQEVSRHSIGTDEIAEVARKIDARLLITINAHTASPQEAADWAAYIRDTHGADLVALWEIGNEHYLAGDMAGAERPPAEYAALLRAYAAAIRAEIPDARIAGIGLLNYGPYRFNAFDDWNEVVLAEAGDVIDVYAIHNAYAPVTTETSMRRGDRVYRAMLAAPQLFARNLHDTHALIRRYQPGRADAITLAVTEWGALFSIDPTNPFFDHAKTLGAAIFAARTLNVFLRDPQTDIATALKLSDWINMGWIGLTPEGGWRATPTLTAVGLYSDTLRGELLDLVQTGPTFDSAATGFTGAVQGAPLIDAVAAIDADGAIGLLVSSAALNETLPLRIELPPGRWRITEARLEGPAPDAHRATRIIDIPGLAMATPQGFSRAEAFTRSSADSVPLTQRPTREAEGSLTLDLSPSSLAALRLTPLR